MDEIDKEIAYINATEPTDERLDKKLVILKFGMHEFYADQLSEEEVMDLIEKYGKPQIIEKD